MSKVSLRVDNKIHKGWTEMRAERSIERPSGAFVLAVSDRFPGQTARWEIERGAECALMLDDATIMTGYIDTVSSSIDSKQHIIEIQGRDRAGDIVDCAALLSFDKTSTLNNISLFELAKTLCEPHNISVTDLVGTIRRKSFSIEPGEAVWDTLERFARQEAVLIISDGAGGIVITRAGKTKHKTALIQGENILSARFEQDDSQRFHRYIVRGQSSTAGDLEWYGENAAQVEAQALDAAIRKNRVTLIHSEALADGVTLKSRAEWEKNIRRARSRLLIVRTSGWSANREVWQPNHLVDVKLPALGLVNVELLITSVAQTLDESGSITELVLTPPDAYTLLPQPLDDTDDLLW